MDSIFPQGLDDENLALDMVKAGQEVMQKSIQKAAQKRVRTGSMAKIKTECRTGIKEFGSNMEPKISKHTHLLDQR